MRRRLEMQIACHSEFAWAYYYIIIDAHFVGRQEEQDKHKSLNMHGNGLSISWTWTRTRTKRSQVRGS